MAESEGLEPPSPRAVVFKTTALPIMLALRWDDAILRHGYCTEFSPLVTSLYAHQASFIHLALHSTQVNPSI